MNNSPRGIRGSVFVIVLWVLVILAMFSMALAASAQQKITILRHLEAKDKICRAAEAGIKQSIAELENLSSGGNEIVGDVPRNHLFLSVDGAEVEIDVEDENGRLNVNKADIDTLTTLFKTVANLPDEAANRLACEIIDYRDADDAITGYFDQGSEKDSYERAGYAYGPKNADFEFPSELLLVKGMTKEIYSLIRNYITIYGEGVVNLNTASKEVLYSLDLPVTLVDKIMATRNEKVSQAGREGHFIFENIGRVQADIEQQHPLNETEKVYLQHAITQNSIGVASRYFKIVSKAKMNQPHTSGAALCIYGVREGIRYWTET